MYNGIINPYFLDTHFSERRKVGDVDTLLPSSLLWEDSAGHYFPSVDPVKQDEGAIHGKCNSNTLLWHKSLPFCTLLQITAL